MIFTLLTNYQSIIDFLPCIQKIPEYLKSINYRNPNDPSFSGLQYAQNLAVDGFTWLGDNPELLTRFNNFMEGYRGNRPHWTEWFPVHGRIIDSEVLATDTPILVDIGAGRGYDLIKFSKWFPNAAGRLILEDLPTVIDEIRGAYDLEAAGIRAVPFDFFADVQPMKGKIGSSRRSSSFNK